MSDTGTVATDYGSAVFEAWRHSARTSWEDYTRHEFVNGLANGSLPGSAFHAYLIQDYLFLVQYSRAWAMAVVKSDSVRQMRTAAATVNGLINEEIQLHVQVCAEQGISEADLQSAVEARENITYTRYVMDTALSGDLLDMLSVLSPCVFGYGEIGMNLKDCQNTTTLYRQWIDAYCGSEYQDSCYRVAELIEDVASARIGDDFCASPRWAQLCARFDIATRLEVEFWGMGFRLG